MLTVNMKHLLKMTVSYNATDLKVITKYTIYVCNHMYNVITVYLAFKYLPTSSVYLLSTTFMVHSCMLHQCDKKFYMQIYYLQVNVCTLHENVEMYCLCTHNNL